MQREFPWGYPPVQHQQHPPIALPQQGAPAVGLMAPAAWGAPPPAGVIGLGPPVYKTSPLGTHTDLHLLEHGTEPTFQDEMATLFTSDTLLFSDTAVEEDQPRGIVGAEIVENGVLDLATAPLGMPGLGVLPGGLLPHPTQGINRPLVGAGAPAPMVSSAAALAIALASPPLTAQMTQSLGGVIPDAAPGLLGAGDAPTKLPEEVSVSGSGEASADGFALPLLSSEHASASPIKSVLGSEVDLKHIVNEVEEGSSEEDDDKIPSVFDQQQQQHVQQQQRLRLAASPRAVGGGAVGGGLAGRPTPLASSGHSGGRLSHQRSSSRGQINPTGSALGKRPAADLHLTEATKRGGTRRRIPSKRAVSAAFDASSDEEEEDLQYRSARRAYGNGALGVGGGLGPAGGVPARTSSRLQGRPSGYRLDSDYVTYDDFEEPSSPGRGGSRINGAGAGSGAAQQRRGVGNRGGTGRTMTPAIGAVTASGRRAAPSRAGRRTVPLAAQRIRATSARHELKGRPSFAEIVEAGFMRPGPHRFNVGNVEVAAAVGEDGAIMYAGTRYRAISKFALVVLRERNPTRQSCDGWKEVAWNGEKLDALRVRVQAHARQVARQRVIQ